ncbi:hypothetical protein HYDPIDRAFT_110451 [Hydnomerulius pinastri MD-312]|nr:hypothetical protein HYDPIDRAFT_110451 [Hydnomerulius pinastri MD-312]
MSPPTDLYEEVKQDGRTTSYSGDGTSRKVELESPESTVARADAPSAPAVTRFKWSPHDNRLIQLPAPIYGLPEEILVIIYDCVITSESSSCLCKTPGSVCSPRRLGCVSRLWRTIIFSCPALWTHVHVTPYQSLRTLKEHLFHSELLPITVTVHQWPFRNPIPTSGPLSIGALTAQLHSILSLTEMEPFSGRVRSLTIDATESSTFVDFVLQTLTGRGLRFPALKRVSLSGGLRATWSRVCFFDGKIAPVLETLELKNVVVSCNVHRLPWGTGLNLTTLVWKASDHRNGSLTISLSLFHQIVASFPSLTTLELHGHAVALEHVSLESLATSGITRLEHIKILRTSHAFTNSMAAFALFLLLPSVKRAVIKGKCCSGSLACRSTMHAIKALFDFPRVLPCLEDVEFECLDLQPGSSWTAGVLKELGLWVEKRRSIVADEGVPLSTPRAVMRATSEETSVREEGDSEGTILHA